MTVRFAEAELELHAHGAIYWPAEEMLLVSDLHLEKASFLARFGSPLPHYDTRDTLMRLEALIQHYKPRQLICLGDSFHDRNAHQRLQEKERELLTRLVNTVEIWRWILGNHDAALAGSLEGHATVQHQCRNILLTHEPEASPLAQIIGHYHPKARLSLGGLRVSGKCFMLAERLLIMPSFGSFTGGLDSEDEVFSGLNPTPFSRFLMYRGHLWRI